MQEKKKLAIEVDNVQKIYKLYDKPSDRMKEAFGFGKKTKHKLHYALKGVDMDNIWFYIFKKRSVNLLVARFHVPFRCRNAICKR